MSAPRAAAQRGFSLLEITVALAIFGTLILVLAIVTSDMMTWQHKLPIDYMANPSIGGVAARIRKDVVDAYAYGGNAGKYTEQTPDTLILQTLDESGASHTVVWDLSKKHEAHRIVFTGGTQVSEWIAMAIPTIEFTSYPEPSDPPDLASSDPVATRIIAKDDEGRIAIDEIFYPRNGTTPTPAAPTTT